MDDNSAQLSHQNGQLGSGVTNSNQQLGGGSTGGNLNNKQNDGSQNPGGVTTHDQIYSIPGVLHFIQHEFSRFEIERSQWDVDRAELQVCLKREYSIVLCHRMCFDDGPIWPKLQPK